MAFLQGVKGVLPSEHRPRPGSLGFIAQAEEQAGPPGRLPAGRGGIWASHAVPAALRVSAPLGPRPPLDGLRPRSNGAVSPCPLWASPLLGVAGPSGPPRSCRLVPHLLPFAPWPRPPEGALPRAPLCSVRLPPFFPLGPVPGQRVRSPHSPERCRPRASEAACSLSDPGGSSGLPGPHVQFYPHRLRENECHLLPDHRTGEASLVLVWGKGIFAIELTFANLQELDQSIWFGTKLATGPAGRDLLGGGSPRAEFSCGLCPA